MNTVSIILIADFVDMILSTSGRVQTPSSVSMEIHQRNVPSDTVLVVGAPLPRTYSIGPLIGNREFWHGLE